MCCYCITFHYHNILFQYFVCNNSLILISCTRSLLQPLIVILSVVVWMLIPVFTCSQRRRKRERKVCSVNSQQQLSLFGGPASSPQPQPTVVCDSHFCQHTCTSYIISSFRSTVTILTITVTITSVTITVTILIVEMVDRISSNKILPTYNFFHKTVHTQLPYTVTCTPHDACNIQCS